MSCPNKSEKLNSVADYCEIITTRKDNNDVKRILKQYVEKNKNQIVPLKYTEPVFSLNIE